MTNRSVRLVEGLQGRVFQKEAIDEGRLVSEVFHASGFLREDLLVDSS